MSLNSLNKNDNLLPQIFYNLKLLSSIWIVFYLIAFALNGLRLWLSWDNLDSDSKFYAYTIFGISNLIGVVFPLLLRFTGCKVLTLKIAVVSLLIMVAYFISHINMLIYLDKQILFDSLTMLLINFILIIPLGVVMGLRICAFKSDFDMTKDLGISVLLGFVVPSIFYFFIIFLSRLGNFNGRIIPLILITIIALCTCIFTIFTMRSVILLFTIIKDKLSAKYAYIIFGIIIPLLICISFFAILYFNHNDTQTFICLIRDYKIGCILIALNSIAFLLPSNTKNPVYNCILLYVSAVLFTPIIYIAILITPFVPFAIFLIFTIFSLVILLPIILIIVSIKRFNQLFKSIKNFKLAMLISILGISTLPILVIGEAFYYKVQINKALQYVECPNTDIDREFLGDTYTVANAIEWIAYKNNANFLPIISGLRTCIITNFMILPKSKIDRMCNMFLPNRIDKLAKAKNINQENILNIRRYNSPKKFGSINKCEFFKESDNSFYLNIGISENSQESMAKIKFPEGVFATRIKMKIGDLEKSSAIIEKRAALWAYESLVSRTIDPSILYYEDCTDCILRVFPPNTDVEISIVKTPYANNGDIEFVGKHNEEKHLSFTKINGNADFVFSTNNNLTYIHKSKENSLPKIIRKAHWAIVLDTSKNTNINFDDIENTLKMLSKTNPEIKEANVYFSNLNFYKAKNRLSFNGKKWLGLNECKSEYNNFKRGFGGFDFELSHLFVMSDYSKNFSDNDNFKNYPVLVYLSDNNPKNYNPSKAFYLLTPELEDKVALFSDGKTITNIECLKNIKSIAINAFQLNGKKAIAPCDREWSLIFENEFNKNNFFALDNDCKKLGIDASKIKDASSLVWGKFALLRAKTILGIQNPYLLNKNYAEYVNTSKEIESVSLVASAVLLENKSAENSAKVMEQLTKRANTALSLKADTDKNMTEPSELIGIIFLLCIAYFYKRAKIGKNKNSSR